MRNFISDFLFRKKKSEKKRDIISLLLSKHVDEQQGPRTKMKNADVNTRKSTKDNPLHFLTCS
jgi:hypothetical protein